MIERARESDEVLAKQIEGLASVLSSIDDYEKSMMRKKKSSKRMKK